MKLYNAMEESYLKENLIHKWVTNIVRQNDGYEFLLDDEVYLPVYKYALKITKRKTVKLNLVEEKVLQIVSIGVHQVDEIAKILGITRPLLDVTLADLHVKDLISVSSDICSLLKKGEQALSNLERVEKQQDIMKDIYMDSFKGKILENITRYQVVEKGIIDDNKLEPLVQAEDMKVIVSRFEDIQEIFQDEYSATRIADGIRTETQELLTIDGIESVYVVFIKIPLQVFVSTNGWDIEHINPQTPKDATAEEKKNWLQSYMQIIKDREILDNIEKCIQDNYENFAVVSDMVSQKLDIVDNDSISNLVLLHASINRGYKNDCFSEKRKKIIEVERTKSNDEKYIPIGTKWVFLKGYDKASQLVVWAADDMKEYVEDISAKIYKMLGGNVNG